MREKYEHKKTKTVVKQDCVCFVGWICRLVSRLYPSGAQRMASDNVCECLRECLQYGNDFGLMNIFVEF